MVPSLARHFLLALVLMSQVACTLPGSSLGGGRGDGEVQVYVVQNHPALVADIEAGGGPALDAAMANARVNPATREILLLRLQSELPLYRRSPLAMASVITAHGDRSSDR